MQQILNHAILFFLLIISPSLTAQKNLEMAQITHQVKPIIVPNIDSISMPNVWTFNTDFGINVSLSSNKNQMSGIEENGFSATNTIDLNAKYNKKRVELTNELHWQFSMHQTGAKKSNVLKCSDALVTLHDWSFGISHKNKWNVNLITKMNTSVITLFEGGLLKDTSDARRYPVEKFFNPYEINFSPGIKYQPNDYLRVSISPFSFRFFGTTDQNIADQGLYIKKYNADSTHILKSIIKKKGAEFNIWYDRNFNEWVVLQYRIDICSNYDENVFKNGKVHALFITKVRIFNGLYLSYRANIKVKLKNKADKPQFAQVVTLSYGKTF